MMVSDEEKRWIVVGIAMNKVAAPVLRDAVKQGIDTNYTDLDKHCQHLSPPCTLQTLNHGLVRADAIFARLKFQNINNNGSLYGKHYSSYNFNVSDSIDLAKLYLPDYLAQFSAFDESLDLTAILRLLGFKNYMPATVFSPHIQASADDVRENVRNKWGHVDVTEWTDALFNDCFDKLKALVKSLGLTACLEKTTLDQLDDWQTKGCQLILGHAVDRDLLLLVQGEVRGLIKDYNTFEKYLATLRDQDKRKGTALDEHHKRLEALEEKLQEASENRNEEIKKVLERLLYFEGQLSIRLQVVEEKVNQLEQTLTKTDDRVSQLEQSQTDTVSKVELLKHSHTKTADEVELLKQSHTEAAAKVDQLDQRCTKVEQIGLQIKTQNDKPEASSMKTFDLKYCRSKLEDHYQKTATVPTSVWCKKSVVDIHQIYTRLSWVKEKHTPAGTTQSELKHYSDLLTADKNGAIPKRILVQGQTGIGKSTFVKKLLVDWVELNKETGDEQTSVLKNFELVVAVNLKEVSKCQSLEDVIRMSNVFAKEDKYMTDGLIDYITNNQEKVLLIFDGYDEYRSGCSSEIYEIFRGSSLRSCCVLITTRISKADELRGLEDLHAEITGFSEVDRRDFMRRFLADDEASDLYRHLLDRNLQELTKVPLLLLFFCTLWKRGQSKVFPKSKTELYTYIIQFIINHSHIKRSPPHYVNLQSSKEILSEIGKVALQGLLNDDHLFEYSQLSDAVLCDESVFIGLLQITEYTETLQPVGMVSFIHKSIQEFLAAWYIIYKCIPEGGSVGEIGVKLEECLALENVFQFMCGLSEDGASMVFTHLKSVRISDPSLDLSKAIPDLDKETDVPLSDVTDRQRIFNDLVLNSFEEVKSKAELSETCLDCLGSIFLLPSNYMKSFPEDLLLKLRDANTLSFIFEYRELYSELYGRSPEASIQLSRMIDLTKLQVIESFEREKLRKFLIDFLNINHYCFCRFFAVICIRNGQVYFYIKHLKMTCDLHARLITDNVVHSHAAHSSLRQPCLKYLKTLNCFKSDDLMAFPFIKKCKTPPYPPSNDPLKRMMRSFSDKALCPFLEQVPNPSSCTLSIKRCDLTSKGAVKLASLLPIFENVTKLDLSLAVCSAKSVTILVTAIKHKTLVDLILSEIHLTSAVVDALGQSLPELSTLRALRISGMNVCFNEAATRLCAAIKHKSLEVLELSEINMHSAAAEVLGQSLPKLSALQALKISGLAKFSDEKVTFILVSAVAKTLGQSRALSALQKLEISSLDGSRLLVRFVESTLHLEPFEVLKIGGPEPFQTLEIGGLSECSAKAVTRLFTAFKDKTLKKLKLSKIMLTSAVAEALGQSLPEFSAVDSLEISGSDGCSLQDKEMEALFGRFNRPSPLVSLVIDHFSLKGSLSVLTKNLHFFPRLKYLDLSITVDEADLFGLLEKMELLPELENLTLKGIALSHSIRSMVPQLLKLKKLEMLCLKTEDFLKEDLFYVQDAFKGKLRQLTIDVTNYEGEFPEGSLQYLCGGNLREMSVGIIGGKTSQPFSDMDFASEPRTLRYIMVFK